MPTSYHEAKQEAGREHEQMPEVILIKRRTKSLSVNRRGRGTHGGEGRRGVSHCTGALHSRTSLEGLQDWTLCPGFCKVLRTLGSKQGVPVLSLILVVEEELSISMGSWP